MINPYFSVGTISKGAAANSPIAEILFNSTLAAQKPFVLTEIGITFNEPIASQFKLVRSATRGTPDLVDTYQALSEDDSTFSSPIALAVGWTAPPTIAFPGPGGLRSVDLPAIDGTHVVWTWDDFAPLIIKPSGPPITQTSLVLWNFGPAIASIFSINIRVSENPSFLGEIGRLSPLS